MRDYYKSWRNWLIGVLLSADLSMLGGGIRPGRSCLAYVLLWLCPLLFVIIGVPLALSRSRSSKSASSWARDNLNFCVTRDLLGAVLVAALFYPSLQQGQKFAAFAWLVSLAIFCIFAVLFGMLDFVFGAIVQSCRPADEKKRHLERLHGVVLLLGLAAGVSVGLFVGVDGYSKLSGKPEVELYDIVAHSFGPAVAAGTLIALFVAVGSIVFLFERTISQNQQQTTQLLEKVGKLQDDASKAVLLAAQARNELERSVGDLFQQLHARMQVEKLPEPVRMRITRSESHYLNAWFTRLLGLAETDTLRACACSLANSYWSEEAVDVAHWKLVTNSRNYTAFLISVVNALASIDSGRRVHFYTSTPVSPFTLLNWPQEYRIGNEKVPSHGVQDFMNEYMAFIQDIVRPGQPIVHRRFIWTRNQKKTEGVRLPPLFEDWDHYSDDEPDYGIRPPFQNLRFLGIPVCLAVLRRYKNVFEAGASRCHEEVCWSQKRRALRAGDFWERLKDVEPGSALAFPFLKEEFSGEYDRFRDEARRQLEQALQEACKAVAEHVGRLKPDPLIGDEQSKTWSDIRSAVLGQSPPALDKLPFAGEIIVCLQRLSAALAAKGDREGLAPVARLEGILLQAKWWQRWEENYKDFGKFPTFKDFFDNSFHSDGKPTFVATQRLNGDLAPCMETGPEFALVGIEKNSGTNNSVSKFDDVDWIVALKSTISEPWQSGEIHVTFKGSNDFEKYQKAMEALVMGS